MFFIILIFASNFFLYFITRCLYLSRSLLEYWIVSTSSAHSASAARRRDSVFPYSCVRLAWKGKERFFRKKIRFYKIKKNFRFHEINPEYLYSQKMYVFLLSPFISYSLRILFLFHKKTLFLSETHWRKNFPDIGRFTRRGRLRSGR